MSMYGVVYAPLEPGEGPGAKQSMKDECDVNMIVARFAETGLVDHVSEGIPVFVDVSELGDYRSVIEQVRKVDEYFAGLPADVRSEFKNDASRFMSYLESGASQEDLMKLGLAVVGDRRSDKERQRRRDDAREAGEASEAADAAALAALDVEAGTVST